MENITIIEIREATLHDSGFISVCQLLTGKLNTVTIFISKETGNKFILTAIGFGSTAGHKAGKRLISLKPHEDNLNCNLEEGEILIQFE